MASRTRPFLMTGAALASAAAIVAASPAMLPTHDLAVGVPTPLPLSTAKYELTALSDITINGINNAYWNGYGGYVGSAGGSGSPDPYFPNVGSVFVGGAAGALYYLSDNILNTNLDNYYFEIGS